MLCLNIGAPNSLDCPKLIAHRGLASAAPANSIPSFLAAGEANFWAIETDVHKTRDGVLVCNHDKTVDAMYNGSGPIAQMTYDALMKLRLKTESCPDSWPEDMLRMPTFDEYLSICRKYRAIPFIETKSDDIPDVIEAACRYFREEEIVISSGNEMHLMQTRSISDKIFIHHIFSDGEAVKRLSFMGYCGVSFNYPDYRAFPTNLLEEAHRVGVRVCLRAGDSVQAVGDMVAMGLDYIPTNCITPQMMKEGQVFHGTIMAKAGE